MKEYDSSMEISGVGAYDEDWSASNYRYMFEEGNKSRKAT